MIDVSKNIEGIRQEYQMVTSYLTDIQIIEELTEAERTPIEACAQHVSQLEKQRSEFLKIEHKLSDTQYGQMQQEEAKLPGVIRRLKENENYLDKIKKILHTWKVKNCSGPCFEQSHCIHRISCGKHPVYCYLYLRLHLCWRWSDPGIFT